MKVEFNLTLFDDKSTISKLEVLSRIEAAFDDERNILPDEYFWFADELPLGRTFKVTFELIEE